jgi:hypothetical protein
MLRGARGDSFDGCWETGGKLDVRAGGCERPLDALSGSQNAARSSASFRVATSRGFG